MNTKIVMAVAIICIIVVLAFASRNTDQEAIRIGFIGSLTGPASHYGVPSPKSVQLAANEINAGGGILGRHIQIIAEDGKCDGATSATAARKLTEIDGIR